MIELGQDVAPIVDIISCLGDLVLQRLVSLLGVPPVLKRLLHLGKIARQLAIGIHQRPLCRGVQQPLLVVLAVDFDQMFAEALEEGRADGLIVDEGAGAAILAKRPAQQQRVIGIDAVFVEQRLDRASILQVKRGAD